MRVSARASAAECESYPFGHAPIVIGGPAGLSVGLDYCVGLIKTAQQPPSAAALTAMMTAACWAVLSSVQVLRNVTGLASADF